MARMTLQEKIEKCVARSSARVFMRQDFEQLGGYGQVGRALGALRARGDLVKAGYGIYVKTRASSLTGHPVPVASLAEISIEALSKLGVVAKPGSSMRAYAEGKTTQMPMATVLNIGRSRLTRQIGFGAKFVRYEHDVTAPK